MPERHCPLCSQPLPEALTQIQIDSRLQRLASPALAEERERLQKEFEVRVLAQRKKERAEFDRRVQAEREGARRAAAREFEFEIKAALKRAADAEARATKRVERIERQIPQRLRKEMAQTIRLTTRENGNASAMKRKQLDCKASSTTCPASWRNRPANDLAKKESWTSSRSWRRRSKRIKWNVSGVAKRGLISSST
jgi:hypothetical protein